MHVAVIIVSYRTANDVVLCLQALSRQTYTDFDIVICENGGTRDADVLRTRIGDSLPAGQRVTVLAADNPGYAGGINLGIDAAPDADAWWILNPDTQPDAGALAAMLAARARGAGDIIGGVIVEADNRIASVGGRWSPWLGRMTSIGKNAPLAELPVYLARADDLDYVSGACMLVPRHVVDRIGRMPEDYFLYVEEVAWLWQAKLAGFRIAVAPDAKIVHHQGSATGSAASVRAQPRLPIYLNARNIINLTRDARAAPVLIAALALAIAHGVRYARGGAWRQIGYVLAGIAAGLRGERGKPDWLA